MDWDWLTTRDADDYFEHLQELRDGYGQPASRPEPPCSAPPSDEDTAPDDDLPF